LPQQKKWLNHFKHDSVRRHIRGMSAYLILEIAVTDQAQYSRYITKAPAIIERFGGRYLVRGGTVTPVSGSWSPERMVVIEFASAVRAQECQNSPEYREIAPLREQATVSRAIIVEGCAQQ
jgi:uncharacterized protein (DUF1330 family)